DSIYRKQGAGDEPDRTAHALDAGVHLFSIQRRLRRRDARRFADRPPRKIRAERKKFQGAREEIEIMSSKLPPLESECQIASSRLWLPIQFFNTVNRLGIPFTKDVLWVRIKRQLLRHCVPLRF